MSHGLGLAGAIAAMPILLLTTARHGTLTDVVAASVFSTTMLLLYFASTIYHALPAGRAKRVLCRIDHAAIFVFIAGSYTPFTLGVLSGGWGFTLFGLVWGLAAQRRAEDVRRPRPAGGLDRALPRHGLACRRRRRADLRAGPRERHRLAGGRRARLYRGSSSSPTIRAGVTRISSGTCSSSSGARAISSPCSGTRGEPRRRLDGNAGAGPGGAGRVGAAPRGATPRWRLDLAQVLHRRATV